MFDYGDTPCINFFLASLFYHELFDGYLKCIGLIGFLPYKKKACLHSF